MPQPRRWTRLASSLALAGALGLSGGCSMEKMAVRGSMPLMKGGIEAMNRESDLALAEAAIPANLKMIEGMIRSDPDNRQLRTFAAEGFHGYAFAFVEPQDPERAAALYLRCRDHAAAALPSDLRTAIEDQPLTELQQSLRKTGGSSVPAMFWTASCWARGINLGLDDVQNISQLARPVAIMERVLALDEGFYHAGPHLFFGVYYGGRVPMLGGNFELSEQHFDRARELTGGKLLLVDVIEAQYLDHQRQDRQAFHDRLTAVVGAPTDLAPELTFVNQIARQQARALLDMEGELF